MEKKNLLKFFENNYNKKINKNKNSVFKEFEKDKWKRALNHFGSRKKVKIIEVDKFFLDKKKYKIFLKKKFEKLSVNKLKAIQFEFIKNELEKYYKNANQIVEIGAGYGSNIIRLAKYKKFIKKQFLSLDYSRNSIQLCKKIAKANKIKNIKFGWCDLYKGVSKCNVEKKSLIFTSYCLHYGKLLPKSFMEYLIKIKPMYVFHFEPIYEFFNNKKTPHMKLCKRYAINNEYSKNLMKILNFYKLKNKIQIIHIKKNIMGINPFLPFSIVIWKLNEKK